MLCELVQRKQPSNISSHIATSRFEHRVTRITFSCCCHVLTGVHEVKRSLSGGGTYAAFQMLALLP